jgi:hypothetical protein
MYMVVVVYLVLEPLSATVALQRKTIADLRRQVYHLERNSARGATKKFSVDSVKNSSIPGLFKFYTGFTYSFSLPFSVVL